MKGLWFILSIYHDVPVVVNHFLAALVQPALGLLSRFETRNDDSPVRDHVALGVDDVDRLEGHSGIHSIR
jgi:hypothetical protein